LRLPEEEKASEAQYKSNRSPKKGTRGPTNAYNSPKRDCEDKENAPPKEPAETPPHQKKETGRQAPKREER